MSFNNLQRDSTNLDDPRPLRPMILNDPQRALMRLSDPHSHYELLELQVGSADLQIQYDL